MSQRARPLALACLLAATPGCLLPALVGGTTISADELQEGTSHFALENEYSRNLLANGLKDANGAYNDVYWLSSDLSFRRGLGPRLGVEASVKFAWALPLPLPAPIGLGGGVLWRLDDPAPWLHLAVRGQLTGGGISLSNTAGGVTSSESASFFGGTLSLLATARPVEQLALTVAPFVRAFGYGHTRSRDHLDKTGAVAALGLSANLQLRLWVLELVPMGSLEVCSPADGGAPFVVPTAGLSAGLRF